MTDSTKKDEDIIEIFLKNLTEIRDKGKPQCHFNISDDGRYEHLSELDITRLEALLTLANINYTIKTEHPAGAGLRIECSYLYINLTKSNIIAAVNALLPGPSEKAPPPANALSY